MCQVKATLNKTNCRFILYLIIKNAIKTLTAEMVKPVTHGLTHVKFTVETRKIVRLRNRPVTLAQAIVSLVGLT